MFPHREHTFPNFLFRESFLGQLLDAAEIDEAVSPLSLGHPAVERSAKAWDVHGGSVSRQVRKGVATPTDVGVEVLKIASAGDVETLEADAGLCR